MDEDAFQQNISGVKDLVESGTNKVNSTANGGEGVVSEYIDNLDLPMTDEKLLELSRQWTSLDDAYSPKIKPKQNKNKLYYLGKQKSTASQQDTVVSSNLIFEAEETFIAESLAKNPEPVVWSDNTDEGKAASNDIKTMLQFDAEDINLRGILTVMVRHHEIYFTAIVKHGWDEETKSIKTEIRKPQNFLFDPDGYVDENSFYCGRFLGEGIESTGEELIALFPKHTSLITIKCDGKLGTSVVRTEWWTDKYCFITFADKVLDKYKNPNFNYETPEKTDEDGAVSATATPAYNHFAIPKMPYSMLSVFTLQERPHDITSLIEQNIPNQDRINDRDDQISKNLASGNNAVILSGQGFNSENASQVVDSFYEDGFILNPSGQADAVKRLPASPLPAGVLESLAEDKDTLRSVFGTNGLTYTKQDSDTTARGMILNQSHDSSRIGGSIGDALERVAKNIFNQRLQLYYVFYDEPHYGAVMGNGRAVEYVKLIMANQERKFIVSVSANSMKPKDELTEMNQAVQLWEAKALDPIGLFKKLNDPDPMATAERVAMWVTNPQMYMMTYFPQSAPQPNSANPPVGSGQAPPLATGGSDNISQEPASADLSQVPLPA